MAFNDQGVNCERLQPAIKFQVDGIFSMEDKNFTSLPRKMEPKHIAEN